MQDRPALAAAVRSVLRPLVRILLRNKVDVWTLVEAVKQIYVDVAAKEFAGERKPSVSRVSLLTGLYNFRTGVVDSLVGKLIEKIFATLTK